MAKGRMSKERPAERPLRRKSWWSRNWRYVDSGLTAGCLPAVALLFLVPVMILT
jgi:hypothetical protein